VGSISVMHIVKVPVHKAKSYFMICVVLFDMDCVHICLLPIPLMSVMELVFLKLLRRLQIFVRIYRTISAIVVSH